jgi:hypothetical protein
MAKILESLPHVFTENAEDFNMFRDYIKNSEEWFEIVDFLNEAEEEDYILDADCIRHILNLDFDYIRNQHKQFS